MSANCPKCNGNGFVIDKRKLDVKMECVDCRYRWRTLSMICPECNRPNGFAVEGLCCQCYSRQLNHK